MRGIATMPLISGYSPGHLPRFGSQTRRLSPEKLKTDWASRLIAEIPGLPAQTPGLGSRFALKDGRKILLWIEPDMVGGTVELTVPGYNLTGIMISMTILTLDAFQGSIDPQCQVYNASEDVATRTRLVIEDDMKALSEGVSAFLQRERQGLALEPAPKRSAARAQ